MKAFTKLFAGVALAFGISHAASAAVYNLDFPNTDPTYAFGLVEDCGVAGCSNQYNFTLTDPIYVEINAVAIGIFGSYDWALTSTSTDPYSVLYSGGGGPVFGFTSLVGLGPVLLQPDSYAFFMNVYNGSALYLVAVSDPPGDVPIPGAALLFGSGLAALGFTGRKRRKKTGPDTVAVKA